MTKNTKGRVNLKVEEEEEILEVEEDLEVEAHPISLKGRQAIKRRKKETQILGEYLEAVDLMGEEDLE